MKMAVILIGLLLFLPAEARAADSPEVFRRGECGAFLIGSAAELAEIQAQARLFADTRGRVGSLDFLAADFVLDADIDLAGEWTPIGDFDADSRFVFSGTLDGAGFAIRGLEITGGGVILGLFGKAENAEIRNVVLCSAKLHARGDYGRKEFSAGLLVGEIFGGVIENVRIISGEVSAAAPDSGNGAVGGLAGKATATRMEKIFLVDTSVNDTGVSEARKNPPLRAIGGLAGCVEDCEIFYGNFFNGKISANAISAGGIAGEIRGGKFSDCIAQFAEIHGAEAVGGFAGLVRGNAVFENCRAVANVRGSGTIGGFAGRVNGAEAGTGARNGAEFLRCRAFGDVKSDGASVLAGGFVGRLAGRSRVSRSHAHGNVIGGFAGGFAGEITNASRIEFSSATGAVAGSTEAGGFVAIVSAVGAPNTITASLALGGVVSGENARRFAARLDHDGINGCYAALGMAVVSEGAQARVIPNPYGPDGGDISRARLKKASASNEAARRPRAATGESPRVEKNDKSAVQTAVQSPPNTRFRRP